MFRTAEAPDPRENVNGEPLTLQHLRLAYVIWWICVYLCAGFVYNSKLCDSAVEFSCVRAGFQDMNPDS